MEGNTILDKILLVAAFSPFLMYFLSLGSGVYELHYGLTEIGEFSIFPTLIGFYHGSFYYLKERILERREEDSIFPYTNLASLTVNFFFTSIYFYYYANKSMLKFFVYLLLILIVNAIIIVVYYLIDLLKYRYIYKSIGVILNCLYFIQDFQIWKCFSKSKTNKFNILSYSFGIAHSFAWVIYSLKQTPHPYIIFIPNVFGFFVSLFYIILYCSSVFKHNKHPNNKETTNVINSVLVHEK